MAMGIGKNIFPVFLFISTTFAANNEKIPSIPEEGILQEKTFTNGDSEYQFYPTVSNLVSFKVLAPEYASIALSNTPDKRENYIEIVLGGEKIPMNLIKSNGVTVKASPGSVLHPTNFSSFWVKWDYIHDNESNPSMLVQLGGKDEDEAFFSWVSSSIFNVNFFGVTTSNKQNGTWIITNLKHAANTTLENMEIMTEKLN